MGKYDVVIIDLFDPSNDTYDSWKHLLKHIDKWVRPGGSIVMYAGIRERTSSEQPYDVLAGIMMNMSTTNILYQNHITPYHVFIPSFLGESTFILLSSDADFKMDRTIRSHMTDCVWNSYRTFNW